MTEQLRAGHYVSSRGYTRVDDDSKNVYDAAIERIRRLFAMSDRYVVSFSGGKDSTAVLMLSLEVARELGRLPLDVVFIDEEVLDPDTIAYTDQVRGWPDIRMAWLCVPVRHTLRGKGRSHWHTWDPDERHVWAREQPAGAISELPDYDRGGYGDAVRAYYGGALGWDKWVEVLGIRAQESFNRRRVIFSVGNFYSDRGYAFQGRPIYDWTATDIWKAMLEYEWPHSAFYDRLWLKGVSLTQQRIGPWGNVANAVAYSQYYPEFYPEFWERAIQRLPELRAAWRYGNTKLFREVKNKPAGMTWQEYAMFLIDGMDDDSQTFWLGEIEAYLLRNRRYTTQPLPEDDKDMLITWKKIAFMIQKNDRINGRSRDAL